jgi:hypothetical protein
MSIGQRGPAVLHASLQRLDELSKLERDWDSYGALPLSSTALAQADATMRKAVDLHGATLGKRVAPYTIMPIADGGVSVEWRGNDATLELDIGPSGALSYLLIDHSAEERQFEEASDISREQALDLVRRVLGG